MTLLEGFLDSLEHHTALGLERFPYSQPLYKAADTDFVLVFGRLHLETAGT